MIQPAQNRQQKLMQSRKRHPDLRLRANGSQHRDAAGTRLSRRHRQQRRLPDPSIAPENENPTSLRNPRDNLIEDRNLRLATKQPPTR
jgi:hypothetical protein